MHINQLTVYTRHLEGQTAFYLNTLGLTLVQQTGNSATFQIGKSTLRFMHRYTAKPYHYAINIPANKAPEAMAWLKNNVKLLKDGDKELIDFKAWKAQSVYFYDKDKNIVELIARKTLKNPSKEPFGPKQFLSISEVGIAVPDIETVYNQLNKMKKLPIYSGDFKEFCAAGDENGLFILANRYSKKWYPSFDNAQSADLTITGDYNFEFVNGKIS